MYEVYVDKWGRKWVRLNEDTVWNSSAGFGGWYDGIGLVLVDNETITAPLKYAQPGSGDMEVQS